MIWERGHLPANEHGGWATAQYGDRTWADFIKLLDESGAAELVPQNAGGQSKLRVKFISSLTALRGRDLTDETAARFWEMAEARR
ncbi:hypothetical protein [Dactylosporangium sp. NPDC005555]|uniref:hypothetical protein n=1 Tax=Dactylosporangium sp. NPDC005555 TaxID=3154889 RepID=UPI0033AE97B3